MTKAEDILYCTSTAHDRFVFVCSPDPNCKLYKYTKLCLQPHPINTPQLCTLHINQLPSTKTTAQGAMSGRLQATESIDQGAISSDSQRQRYASFFCFSYWLMNKHGPRGIARVLHRSASLTMTPFSMCFIFFGHLFLAKIRTETLISGEGMVDGPAHIGGILLCMSAKDGERSYSDQHLTWNFPLSVQMARPLRTC